MLKKRSFYLSVLAVLLVLTLVFSLSACKDESGSSSSFDPYPKRYIVTPAWTTQGDTIAVGGVNTNQTVRVALGNGTVGHLPVIYKDYEGGTNNYLIYLGKIDNVPMDTQQNSAQYNGVTPVNVKRENVITDKKIMEESFKKAVTVSSVVTSESDTYVSAGFQYKCVGVRLNNSRYRHSVNTSIETSEQMWTMTTEKSKSETDGIEYTIGHYGEPAGRYRLALFATVDVYLSISLCDNNIELISEQVVVCARESSFTYKLDYDPNQAGDWPRTGGGGMLPIPDAYTTLSFPKTVFQFVAVGDGARALSSDGINWKMDGGVIPNGNCVAVGNDMFVIPAGNLMHRSISPNIASFAQFTPNSPFNFTAISYAAGSWAAVGNDGRVARSINNMVNWTDHRLNFRFNNTGAGNPTKYPVWHDVAYGDDRWIAVGSSSHTWETGGVQSPVVTNRRYFISIASLNDPVKYPSAAWTMTQIESTSLIEWRGITYGGDKFVAVGRNGMAYSTDEGVTWTNVGSGSWNKVAYNNGAFVAVGNDGRIAYSTNGINWLPVNVSATDWLNVAYGNGRWVAVGGESNSAMIAHSTDGINWTINIINGSTSPWRSIAFGKFFVED